MKRTTIPGEDRVKQYPNSTLQKEADRICQEWRLPTIQVFVNPRLKTVRGKFFSSRGTDGRKLVGKDKDFIVCHYGYNSRGLSKMRIEIAGFMINSAKYEYTGNYIMRVLYHELAHYIDYAMYGRPGHGSTFQEINNLLGGV